MIFNRFMEKYPKQEDYELFVLLVRDELIKFGYSNKHFLKYLKKQEEWEKRVAKYLMNKWG